MSNFNPRTHIECDSEFYPVSGNTQPQTNHFASISYHSTPNKATLLHFPTHWHILEAVFGAGDLGILCALGVRTLNVRYRRFFRKGVIISSEFNS
ncbi:hypothetical protein J26TS2_25180 [Shouchella clausii]|nr:hypothetical protein J26TS2_25180 [Shouchella clausii]